MFKFQKKKCTQQTDGVIVQKKWNSRVWHVTVEYRVNGRTYKRVEQVKYYAEKVYRIFGIPIGARWAQSLGIIEEGDVVRVSYNPKDPSMSYLTDNTGWCIS